MSYQYAGAMHARKTDVRVTASRIGLLLLESWVAAGGIDNIDIYNPADKLALGSELPFPSDNFVPDAGLSGVPGLGTQFQSYGVFTNGTWFWVRLTYNEEGVSPLWIRELGVSVAWSLDFAADSLTYDPQRLLRFSKSVIYVLPNTGT